LEKRLTGLTRGSIRFDQDAFVDVVERLTSSGISFCVYANDRAGADAAAHGVRKAKRRREASTPAHSARRVETLVLRSDAAEFARERDYATWLAMAHEEDAPIRVLVTTDACGPSSRDGDAPARVDVLVNRDCPQDAGAYRARMANAFAETGDDCDGGHRASVSRLVISILGVSDADAWARVSASLPRDVAELSPHAFESMAR